MEHDNYNTYYGEIAHGKQSTSKIDEVSEKMAKVGRTKYKIIRRPRWKEYTLIKYKDMKEISREKIWIDESKYFPSDEDFSGNRRMRMWS